MWLPCAQTDGGMDVLVLAAGYGTRLGRDIAEDRSGRYTHLVNVPKPLLPIGSEMAAASPSMQPHRPFKRDSPVCLQEAFR